LIISLVIGDRLLINCYLDWFDLIYLTNVLLWLVGSAFTGCFGMVLILQWPLQRDGLQRMLQPSEDRMQSFRYLHQLHYSVPSAAAAGDCHLSISFL